MKQRHSLIETVRLVICFFKFFLTCGRPVSGHDCEQHVRACVRGLLCDGLG